MLTILACDINIERLTYFQAGMEFLHAEELNGGTVQYWDPEDEKWWFSDVESVALLGKALKYHEGFLEIREYDEQILIDILMASITMEVYDNWKEKVKPW